MNDVNSEFNQKKYVDFPKPDIRDKFGINILFTP